MKGLMGTVRKETVVGVKNWELESYLFKALVLPTFMYGIEIWGGDLKKSHRKVFEKGTKISYDVSHQIMFSGGSHPLTFHNHVR
jgi:hypothetical protein